MLRRLFGKGKAEEAGPRQFDGQDVIDRSVLQKQNLGGGIIPMFQEDLATCLDHVRQGIAAQDAARTTQYGSNGLRSLGTSIGSTPLRSAAESMTKAVEIGDWSKAAERQEALAELVNLCIEELGDLAKEHDA